MAHLSKANAKKGASVYQVIKILTDVDDSISISFSRTNVLNLITLTVRKNKFFIEKMVLGLLFSLQNNILNITGGIENETGLLINKLANENSSNINLVQSMESIRIITDFASYG